MSERVLASWLNQNYSILATDIPKRNINTGVAAKTISSKSSATATSMNDFINTLLKLQSNQFLKWANNWSLSIKTVSRSDKMSQSLKTNIDTLVTELKSMNGNFSQTTTRTFFSQTTNSKCSQSFVGGFSQTNHSQNSKTDHGNFGNTFYPANFSQTSNNVCSKSDHNNRIPYATFTDYFSTTFSQSYNGQTVFSQSQHGALVNGSNWNSAWYNNGSYGQNWSGQNFNGKYDNHAQFSIGSTFFNGSGMSGYNNTKAWWNYNNTSNSISGGIQQIDNRLNVVFGNFSQTAHNHCSKTAHNNALNDFIPFTQSFRTTFNQRFNQAFDAYVNFGSFTNTANSNCSQAANSNFSQTNNSVCSQSLAGNNNTTTAFAVKGDGSISTP